MVDLLAGPPVRAGQQVGVAADGEAGSACIALATECRSWQINATELTIEPVIG